MQQTSLSQNIADLVTQKAHARQRLLPGGYSIVKL
jgi:hypothetical protein